MSNRKLAHIERVVKVEPILGADKIEKVTVLGWEVVCRKGEVKEGDLVAYLEIDSVVPQIPYFNFMSERRYRVKTIKLRKQVSQGLIIKITDIYPIMEELGKVKPNKNYLLPIPYADEGDDVTELLGITKYESSSDKESSGDGMTNQRKKKYPWYIRQLTRYQWFRVLFHMRSKSFPSFIPKTDEERIQNIPWKLSDKTPNAYYVTEKIDGCSATFARHKKLWKEHFYICSRNVLKHEIDRSKWSQVFKENEIKLLLKTYGKNIAIQGEIVGFNIQGNPYKLQQGEIRFYVFNIWDIDKRQYYNFNELKKFCSDYGLKMVPIVDSNYTLPDMKPIVDYSNNKSLLNSEVNREGIVVRSKDESSTKRVSFKCVSPNYLLTNEE